MNHIIKLTINTNGIDVDDLVKAINTNDTTLITSILDDIVSDPNLSINAEYQDQIFGNHDEECTDPDCMYPH